MMHSYKKVRCTDCIYYTSCTQKTRLFINYCGSKSSTMQGQIEKAREECRTRRARIFRFNSPAPALR
ncbi:MAG: hypothetical protein ACLFSB_02225 [Chitinispirillaceae bacterium]